MEQTPQSDPSRSDDREKNKEAEALKGRIRALEAAAAEQAAAQAEQTATIDRLRREVTHRQEEIYRLRWWMEQAERDLGALFHSQTWKIGRRVVQAVCRLTGRKADATVEHHLNAIFRAFHDRSQPDVESPSPSTGEPFTTERVATLREKILRDARGYFEHLSEAPIAVMAVTTCNRKAYLDECIRTWSHTRSDRFRWKLIVADDGSSDGTLEYLDQLTWPDIELEIIRNGGDGIHHQNNTIFKAIDDSGFDVCFMVDDDMVFREAGWDLSYYYLIKQTGFDHLVYYSTDWHPAMHAKIVNDLVSLASCEYAQGCFYTVTQRVLDAVGYNDRLNFGRLGLGHVDYTTRCCRAGFNLLDSLLDIPDSAYYMALQARETYTPARPVAERNAENPESVLTHKRRIIATDNRIHIPYYDSTMSLPPRRLSIIIPHYSFDATRNRNLQYIITYYHHLMPDAQIIIVEQNSQTELPDFVEHIYIENEQAFSRSLSFNEGARQADGDVFLLVDNDCIVHEECLREFVTGTKYTYLDMVIPYGFVYDLSEQETMTVIETNKMEGGIKRGQQNVGGATLITKAAYHKIGGFDPQFFGWGMEDNAFYEKCRALLTSLRAEEYRLYHLFHEREKSAEDMRQTDEYRKNCLEYMKIKHFTNRELLEYISHLGTDHFT